jgi:guanosine-3',5'-bis(diphosphate) 3'-pyrophosphohydrolase
MTFNPVLNRPVIEEAVAFAKAMHEGQTRASGRAVLHPPARSCRPSWPKCGLIRPPLSRPFCMTRSKIRRPPMTNLKKKFGVEVADLVNGVSKLTKIESQTAQGKQAENFRKLLLAMSEDIRVLLVKLADRLHNMRTHGHYAPGQTRRVSRRKRWKFTRRWPSASVSTKSRKSWKILFCHAQPRSARKYFQPPVLSAQGRHGH